MSYKILKYGKKTQRRNYSRVLTNVELPNLIDIQTESFKWFVKDGIRELFEEISPIDDSDGNRFTLQLTDPCFKEPVLSIKEAKRRSKNYASQLYVKATLHQKNLNDGVSIVKDIYLGDYPMMTPWGTFVIEGNERVVVTQIVRSAGAFYARDKDKKTGHNLYSGVIIPTRGAWIEFEMDAKDILYAKVDREKKITLTQFILALGFDNVGSFNNFLFGDRNQGFIIPDCWRETQMKTAQLGMKGDKAIVDLYSKMKPGETINSAETARQFLASRIYDKRRYDLARVGRYKINLKLDVVERAKGNRLINDFCDELGNVLIPANTEIRDAEVKILQSHRELFTVEKCYNDFTRLADDGHFVIENDEDGNIKNSFKVQILDIYRGSTNDKVRLVGNYQTADPNEGSLQVCLSDIIASISYYLNLTVDIGDIDDIDNLSNRRLRTIGELLQNEFRTGLQALERRIHERMTTTTEDPELKPERFISERLLFAPIREFFNSSQLSQFMDQINPLSELTHKRRISALGKGGISRDRAGFEVRDVHPTHYGRICPVETPEGQNIGLINSISTFASTDPYGFIQTPYLKVDQVESEVDGKKVVKTIIRNDLEPVTMTAVNEIGKVIAEANVHMRENDEGQIEITDDRVTCHIDGDFFIRSRTEIEYIDVSPKQIVAVSPACIPFLEHDDTTRALMGSNMQRQAVPIIKPESPIVGTGVEAKTAKDSGAALLSEYNGIVTYVDGTKIVIKDEDGERHDVEITKFARSNSSTCVNQRPIVEVGEQVKVGDILADGPSMDQGELALGRNVVIAFMTWNGYNFEDAVIMSERLVQQDYYTSIHLEEYSVEVRDTKNGKEQITNDLDGEKHSSIANLGADGIVRIGAEVHEGDTLVGKISPKGQTDPNHIQKFCSSLFPEASRDYKVTSLKVPHGGDGIVTHIEHFKRNEGVDLGPTVLEKVRVYIVQKRKISQGDKMSGRHGNKGVISNIVPIEDMPFMDDGTPIDIMLNPQGVPSRMNIGQVLEIHLGLAAKRLGVKIATPVFDGVTSSDLVEIMNEARQKNRDDLEKLGADLDPNTIYADIDEMGKTQLYDGRTGRPFDHKTSVGVMYMIKLDHMVDDKIHARNFGRYTLVTQQPMGGKAQNGGQRFGEMEVWALESYGAAYTLQEMMTIKSDDMIGRNKTWNAIINGEPLPRPGVPEAFRALIKELQGLGLSVKLIDNEGNDVANKSIVDEMRENRAR